MWFLRPKMTVKPLCWFATKLVFPKKCRNQKWCNVAWCCSSTLGCWEPRYSIPMPNLQFLRLGFSAYRYHFFQFKRGKRTSLNEKKQSIGVIHVLLPWFCGRKSNQMYFFSISQCKSLEYISGLSTKPGPAECFQGKSELNFLAVKEYTWL